MEIINQDDPHGGLPVLFYGNKLEEASAGMIMLHGRGANAENILALSNEFRNDRKFIFAAPQAQNNTWYPYSFLAPRNMNEPGISSGLDKINSIIHQFEKNGIEKENIILLGFSQGACLVLEYAARNPQKFGGIVGLSGGLIGEKLNRNEYSGSFLNTPIFLGCSNIDPHIPLARVNETEAVFHQLGGSVTKKIYNGMEHTINDDEIVQINRMIAHH